MARPHPVVGLAAELAHRCRRSPHETDIPIYLGHNEILHVVVEEADYPDLAVRILLFCLLEQFLALFVVPVASGDVGHGLEKLHAQTRNGDFLFPAHSPESVLEVVVILAGKGLDAGVAAMVIGHQESAAGDDFPGAPAAELHDRILDGRVVDAVYLVGCQPGPEVCKRLTVNLFEERKHPHSLVCPELESQAQGDGHGNKCLLHFMVFISFHLYARLTARTGWVPVPWGGRIYGAGECSRTS